MNRQRLLFAEAVHTPDAGEDIFLAQRLSRIRHKQGKQLEFLSSKLQLVSIQAGSMLITLYRIPEQEQLFFACRSFVRCKTARIFAASICGSTGFSI